MNIDIERLTELAQLKLSKEEQDRMQRHIHKLLEWIHMLDTANIPDDPIQDSADKLIPMIDDTTTDDAPTQDLLANAPQSMYDMICVPKVLEGA